MFIPTFVSLKPVKVPPVVIGFSILSLDAQHVSFVKSFYKNYIAIATNLYKRNLQTFQFVGKMKAF